MDDEFSNDGESQEPQVCSNNADERKLARQVRIRKRLETAKRLQAIADGEFNIDEPDKPLLDQTIEECNDQLFRLLLEGKELVTNVQVASDAREVQRREAEVNSKKDRIQKLQDESESALEKFKDITSKWEIIVKSNDPLNLNEDMREQKERCLELIHQKDVLIEDLQRELLASDEVFMKDRKKMFDDVSMLARRIDDQVTVMKRAIKTELELIEEAIETTRSEILTKNQRVWEGLYEDREKEEIKTIDRKLKLVAEHEEELEQVHRDHEEKYRETKIRLETDIQVLEQELEQLKAVCLLNSEKLDYNFQVLKKREEENIYIKNHQKKQLNKLQEMANNLRKKIDGRNTNIQQELKRLTKEVQRYHKDVIDTEKKADHFSAANDKQYEEIWEMNAQEATELLNKILITDQIIHEQILGLDWEPPSIQLLNRTDLPSYKSAMNTVRALLKKNSKPVSKPEPETPNREKKIKSDVEKGRKRLLRHILELIADQSGFLIDEKLQKILRPYTKDEKTLVLLDNVFTAIGIRTEQDILALRKHFIPYAVCEECGVRSADSSTAESSQSAEEEPDSVSERSCYNKVSSKLEMSETLVDQHETTESAQSDGSDNGDMYTLLEQTRSVESRTMSVCNESHLLLIDKIFVLKALREFVSSFHEGDVDAPPGMSVTLGKQRNTVSRLLVPSDVEMFWNRYHQIFPPGKVKVWDALFTGLTKYHEILQERHKLNMKTQNLRQQNNEMRRLLQKYLKDKTDRRMDYALPHIDEANQDSFVKGEDLIQIISRVSF